MQFQINMGKKKKAILARKVGRPKGITKLYGSKDITKCPVPGCGKTARNDKIIQHQIELVLFNDDGQAASEDNPRFKNLSKVEKAHTLYFNSVGATDSKFPENIFSRSSKEVQKMVAPGQSMMDKFVTKSGRENSRDGLENATATENERINDNPARVL